MLTEPYRVVLAEAETGIVLNRDGSRYLSMDGRRWEPTFQSLDEALALKDQLLDEFPFAEVITFGGPKSFQPVRFTAQEPVGLVLATAQIPNAVEPTS